MKKLRPYQQEGVEAVVKAFADSGSTLLSWATGLGKTVMFAHLIQRMLADRRGRCMVMVHRKELLEQAADKIKRVMDIPVEVEKAEQYADRQRSGLFRWKAGVVLTTVQTQVASHGDGHRMDRFDPSEFGLLVVDEAHHATAATYKAVIEHYSGNPELKVLGVTATPNRHDEEALGQVFESVAHEVGILDGIMDGWLVDIMQQSVYVDSMDLSNVKVTAGDLNGRDLAVVMEYEANLHGVVQPTIELAGERKTLVFAASVAQAERMSEIFNRHQSGSAAIVHGGTPEDERTAIIQDFRAGNFQRLCNCGIATEGFDVDDIACIACARPTKSQPLYQQMIGRGTRVLESLRVDEYENAADRLSAITGSGKPDLLVLDFVGNAGKHKLMSPVDALGGNYGDDVLAIARDGIRQTQRPESVREALSEAEKKEREQSRMMRESAGFEEQRRRRGFRPDVAFTAKEINPFDVMQVAVMREPGWHKGRLPSTKQVAALEGFGVKGADRYTFSAASQLIGQLIERIESKRCTYPQARVLKRHRFSIDCTIEEASAQISRIAESGWKLRGHK